MGFLSSLTKIFGSKSDKDLKLLLPVVDEINEHYANYTAKTDNELRELTNQIREVIASDLLEIDRQIAELHARIASETDLDIDQKEDIFDQIDGLEDERNKELEVSLRKVLPQAFAVVKETARRFTEQKELLVDASDLDRELSNTKSYVTVEGDTAKWINKWNAAGNEIEWNMVHYDVQLVGGIVLHDGKIAEMATGEGKTLVATLPAYLNALAKRGVHIVTVNDYLAKRDAAWMAPIMEFHGLRVDCIDNYEPHSPERIKAYKCDITYGTNNEFGFDYLRDNMARTTDEQVQPTRPHYAMVDEVDSVLIDEARTPLIISGPVDRSDDEKLFIDFKPRVEKVVSAQKRLTNDFLTEARKKIKEGDEKEGGLALFRAYRGNPKYKPLIKFLSEPGMRQILNKTENYYMQDNNKQMPIADQPLLFTIDEKMNTIDLTQKGIELITKENEESGFFVMPNLSVEIDRIEKDEELTPEERAEQKEALTREYSAKTQRIHTVNQMLKAYTLFEKDVDYIVQDNKVKIVDEQTGRVMDGRRYSDGLHQALEAKESVKIEATTQTYATVTLQNYFRRYHKLAGMTGTAETEAGEFWEIYKLDVVVIPTNRPIARLDSNDKIYKTMREKFNAVVEEIQAMVEAGRPVLVGTTSVEISELLSRFLQRQNIKHQVLNAKQHQREAEVVAEAGKPGTVTIATNMAGRGTDIKLTPESKAAGGLAIIGTERHDSRRVDRQLRGRSGRQGDPGSSRFFISLEDDLMRKFNSQQVAKAMNFVGHTDGEALEAGVVTRSIERAQKKVEENNFGVRKRLLEFDDVMNKQREVIYARRKNALEGERLELDIMEMFYSLAEQLVHGGKMTTFEEFEVDVLKVFGLTSKITQEELAKEKPEVLSAKLYQEAFAHYRVKQERIRENVDRVLKRLHEERGGQVKQVFIPYSDGNRGVQIPVNLEEAVQSDSRSVLLALERGLALSTIDNNWKEHLREMDNLRDEVRNASFEQKDPLLIYKKEGFTLFRLFIDQLSDETIGFLSKCQLMAQDTEEVSKQKQQAQKRAKLQEQKDAASPRERAANAMSPTGQSEPRINAPRREVEVTKPRTATNLPNRNDKVSVRYEDGKVVKDVKFKKVEQDVLANRATLI